MSEKKSPNFDKLEKKMQKELKDNEEAEQAAIATATELMAEDEKPTEIYVPILKKKILVRELQFGDYPELRKVQETKDVFQIAVKTLLCTWGRADTTVTDEFLARFSLKKVLAILEALDLGEVKTPLPEPTQTPSP